MKMLVFIAIITNICFIYSEIIQTNNLTDALLFVKPNDVIELLSGTYSSVPYVIPYTKGNFEIKPVENANVIFTGDDNSCIIESSGELVTISGPIEFKDALCGIKLLDFGNLKGLKIHNMKTYGIYYKIGFNSISDNELYSNEIGIMMGAVIQGGTISGNIFKNNKKSIYSELVFYNINFENNIIYNSEYGFFFNISNGFSDGNSFINNIIINSNTGIGLFGTANYVRFKIYNNIIMFPGISSIYIEQYSGEIGESYMYNNFISISNNDKFTLTNTSRWICKNNYFYNISYIPDVYSDTTGNSKALNNIELDTIFYNYNGKCDYSDKNIDYNCFRPNPYDCNSLNLFQKGINGPSQDIIGCKRGTNPSIGAFEFPYECTNEKKIYYNFEAEFNINYCIYGGNEIVELYDYTNKKVTALNKGQDCNWNINYPINTEFLKYKFVIGRKKSILKWEKEKREINMKDLLCYRSTADDKSKGMCSFKKNDKFSFTCDWK